MRIHTIITLILAAATAHAGNGEDVFKSALRYTVQIKSAVATPFESDNKGSTRGAGFVVDVRRGWIVTNAHVVSRSPARVEVMFRGRDYVPARKVYVDPYLDLAIIAVDEEMVRAQAVSPALDCANMPAVGHPVGAFGHPNNLKFTGTRGIVSGRPYGKMETEMLQTDAPINPGNSGGPLISLVSGHVVGINTSSRSGAQNNNFALPIRYACRVLDLLREGRDPSPPEFPVMFFTDIDERNRLKVANSMIDPAELELRQGDEILGIPGVTERIENETQLIDALRGRLDKVTLRILRDNAEIFVRGKLRPVPKVTEKRGVMFSGVLFEELPSSIRQSGLDLGNLGVAYVEEGSLGEFNEIERTFLNSVNGQSVNSLTEFHALLTTLQQQKKPARMVFKKVSDGRRSLFIYTERTLPIENLVWIGSENDSNSSGRN